MNSVYKCGDDSLLKRVKTAFLCSRNVPSGVEQAVNEWVAGLSKEQDCVMCGDQSYLEHMVFSQLLKKGIPVVLVLAQAMPDTFAPELQEAMKAGRLLVITHCDASVHFPTARSANDRNILMIGMAGEVVVGYSTRGGNLSRQLVAAHKVRFLFNDGEQSVGRGNHCAANANESKPTQYRPVPSQWKRRMWSVNKAVTVELDTSAGGPRFIIWQIRDFDADGTQSQRLVFSPKELCDFHDALEEVIIMVGGRNLTDVRAMKVETGAGSVTFDFKMLTADGVLVITQSVETRFMGLRRNVILLNARELRTFYEKISEASVKASEVINNKG